MSWRLARGRGALGGRRRRWRVGWLVSWWVGLGLGKGGLDYVHEDEVGFVVDPGFHFGV